MEQLLAHLLGDYVLQNHWMANEKTKRWLPAVVHVLLYGLPFLLLVDRPEQWLVIVLTHLVIDRFRLARYWVEWWGVGYWPPRWLNAYVGVLTFLNYRHWFNLEERKDAPPFLAVWLLILVDNTMHLCINYAALRWL